MDTYYIYCISHKSLPVGRYIGSTRDVKKREYLHKHYALHEPSKSRLYDIIQKNGGWFCWEMRVLDTIQTNSPLEAKKREQEWIDATDEKINKNRANARPNYECTYYSVHRDEILDQKKAYYQANKDARKAYQIQYRQRKQQEMDEALNRIDNRPKRGRPRKNIQPVYTDDNQSGEISPENETLPSLHG